MGNFSSLMFYAPKDFQYESITMDGTLKVDSTEFLALFRNIPILCEVL